MDTVTEHLDEAQDEPTDILPPQGSRVRVSLGAENSSYKRTLMARSIGRAVDLFFASG